MSFDHDCKQEHCRRKIHERGYVCLRYVGEAITHARSQLQPTSQCHGVKCEHVQHPVIKILWACGHAVHVCTPLLCTNSIWTSDASAVCLRTARVHVGVQMINNNPSRMIEEGSTTVLSLQHTRSVHAHGGGGPMRQITTPKQHTPRIERDFHHILDHLIAAYRSKTFYRDMHKRMAKRAHDGRNFRAFYRQVLSRRIPIVRTEIIAILRASGDDLTQWIVSYVTRIFLAMYFHQQHKRTRAVDIGQFERGILFVLAERQCECKHRECAGVQQVLKHILPSPTIFLQHIVPTHLCRGSSNKHTRITSNKSAHRETAKL